MTFLKSNLLFVATILVVCLTYNSNALAFVANAQLRLGVGSGGNEGDATVTASTPGGEGIVLIEVFAYIIEESIQVDDDRGLCGFGADPNDPIECIAIAIDTTLTDTCKYCMDGTADDFPTTPGSQFYQEWNNYGCKIWRKNNY